MDSQNNQNGFTHWMQESIALKLTFIGVLVLVLLIPSVWIQNLITERSARQGEVTRDVVASWADTQRLKGPMLQIPYKYSTTVKDAKGKETTEIRELKIRVLPEQLRIHANVESSVRKRGIFKVIVYTSTIKVSGIIPAADLKKLELEPEQVQFEKASLIFGVSDMHGLKTNPVVNIAGTQQTAEPLTETGTGIDDGLQVPVSADAVKAGNIPFSFTLDLKGSQAISFMHLAKNTDVQVEGNWPHPKFEGAYLPDTSVITDKGFTANWKMGFNRAVPQQWATDNTLIDAEKTVEQSAFGVKLIVPVDQYQQNMRTSKYAILIILLTFVSLFLTELIRKNRVHVFNYVLIGAAMIVFYTLLLSFSEHIGYNWAYLVASVATIGLISTFIASLLHNKPAAGLFAAILSLFYGFIFIIIQLEDLALMVGSIALFIITAVLMYFSRKINWNRE